MFPRLATTFALSLAAAAVATTLAIAGPPVGGEGVAALALQVEPWTDSAPLGDGSSELVSLDKPVGWTLTREQPSLLLAPVDNPADLGVLLVVGGPELDAAAVLLPLSEVQEQAREALAIQGFASAELIHSTARFDNGRAGSFLVLIARTSAGATVVALAGAAQDVFPAYAALLRQVLLSIRLSPVAP